jgi:FkbM family methyltransferase
MAANRETRNRNWRGIASFSQSVLCLKEAPETKFVFGQVVLQALEMLTAQLGDVPFVQVGANDGVHADHIHPLVMTGKWHGILIEPAPKAYERLLQTYRNVPGLAFVQLAVSTSETRLPFYYVEGDDGLSSLSVETILTHAPKYDDLKGMIREFEVEARTLDSICDAHNLSRPAVVAVDTEGTDDIVLQSFSIEERRPSLILFEHCHLSAERSAAVRDRVLAAGYRLLHDRHDALAIAEGTFEDGVTEDFADAIETARAAPLA